MEEPHTNQDLRANLQLGALEKKIYIFKTMHISFKRERCYWILVTNFVDKIGIGGVLAHLADCEITEDARVGCDTKMCSSALCTMDDASYFLVIRLGPKTSGCETSLSSLL